ncbi:hypothetical protein PIB30_003419 [Stylosanthes scabra]|uniref:Uncharacterized protein n=1 Tax=Stylosanthes scabra TaxID=79078 RepID=A0ABU6U3I9_9FABA|nr:hypothetical protein [Stylosanthes scabra]
MKTNTSEEASLGSKKCSISLSFKTSYPLSSASYYVGAPVMPKHQGYATATAQLPPPPPLSDLQNQNHGVCSIILPTMKTNASGEASFASNSSISLGLGDKLHQACESAVVAATADATKPGRRLSPRRGSCHGEDPIRTLMFLGSWTHT